MAFETFSLADAMRPAQAQRQQDLQAFSLALQAKQFEQSGRVSAAKAAREKRKLELDEQASALNQAKHHLDAFKALTGMVDEGNYEFLKPSIARMLDVEVDAMPGTAKELVGEYQIAKSEYETAKAEHERVLGGIKTLGDGRYLQVTPEGVVEKGARKKTERDKKIEELQGRGFTLQEAQDIADKRVKAMPADAYGNVWLINEATGDKRLAGGGEPAGPAAASAEAPPTAAQTAQAETRTPIEEAAREGTGPVAAVKEMVDAVAGGLAVAVGKELELFPETMENRAHLRQFNQIAKATLINNPRFPVAEQEIVRPLLASVEQFWKNPATAARDMAKLRQFLTDLRSQNMRSIRSPEVSQKEKIRLSDKNAEIDRVLSLMGEPAVKEGEFTSAPQIRNDEDYDKLPSGTEFLDPQGILRRKP